MLKRAFNITWSFNDWIDNLFKFFSFVYHIYYSFFAHQYILQIDNFYCTRQGDYILNLRFRNKSYILTVSIKDIFYDKMFFYFISPIDAYMMGIIYGMYEHKIIYNDSEDFLEYFRKYNIPQISEPMILVSERRCLGLNDEIFLKPKFHNKIIKTSWRDIAKKLYLIQSLSATDAAAVGVISINGFMNELC